VPDRSSGTDDRFSATPDAQRAAEKLRSVAGHQVMLVSWPAGVAYMPAATFEAGHYDRIIGHVARCPVYADVRQLAYYEGNVVLDVDRGGPVERPKLRVHRSR